MKAKDLKIGDKIKVDGEIWEVTDVGEDVVIKNKFWIHFNDPTGLGIFEAWTGNEEVEILENNQAPTEGDVWLESYARRAAINGSDFLDHDYSMNF